MQIAIEPRSLKRLHMDHVSTLRWKPHQALAVYSSDAEAGWLSKGDPDLDRKTSERDPGLARGPTFAVVAPLWMILAMVEPGHGCQNSLPFCKYLQILSSTMFNIGKLAKAYINLYESELNGYIIEMNWWIHLTGDFEAPISCHHFPRKWSTPWRYVAVKVPPKCIDCKRR